MASSSQGKGGSLFENPLTCSTFWDSRRARFDDCFVPFVALLPAAVAALVLLTRLGRATLRKRPAWLRPFVQDFDAAKRPDRLGSWLATTTSCTLVASSCLGLALELSLVFWPSVDLIRFIIALSYTVTLTLCLIDRPTSSPIGCLLILISILAVQIILLFNQISPWQAMSTILAAAAALASGCSVLAVLNMPFIANSADNIATSFQTPTHDLRSPEDSLTPWQFMSVAWMNPLIKVGYGRQLNEDDVWSLSFQFQHKALHDRFRDLKGTVVVRLIRANFIDLVILCALGLFEYGALFSSPALLQLLLRSMEDSEATHRATAVYALLLYFAAILDTQCSVFSMWYGRRCYERSRGEMITMLHEKVLSRKVIAFAPEKGPSDQEKLTKPPASMGKILNLMRNDVYEVSQRFWEFQYMVFTPISLVVSIVLVWKLIGRSCLLGVVTIVLAQCVNAVITRVLLHYERIRRAATDSRLQKTSQFVEAIRHLRWYAWEDFWLDLILQNRQKELDIKLTTNFWNAMISFVNTFGSSMFPAAAFYAYTYWAGLPLTVDIAFPALELFDLLESNLREVPGLINTLLNAKIAVERIEDFMNEPDKSLDSAGVINPRDSDIVLLEASFAWPGQEKTVLKDVSVTLKRGLTIVIGEVASGKSAFLQAILGELDILHGQVVKPEGKYALCTQTPWLQSMSIQENILFTAPYDETRYKAVIEACALLPDFSALKARDLSLIGENGIGLSGGQRARVALARAVYSQANILLLDDPFAALDHQTASFIVQRCFRGPLMADRTIVLVTHRTDLVQGLQSQLLRLENGAVKVLAADSTTPTIGVLKQTTAVTESAAEEISEEDLEPPAKFVEDEKRAHGGVKTRVYWEYVKAGKVSLWIILLLVLLIYRAFDVAKDYFLKEWGEAYNHAHDSDTLHYNPFKGLPSPEQNVAPWITGFFVIAAARSVILFVSQGVMLAIVYVAGRRMFAQMMSSVSAATFRFYDITPTGRLMNRLTSDIGIVDGDISRRLQDLTFTVISWATSIIVIASVTPTFLLVTFLLCAAFVYFFSRFLPTSQSLRRLEMVSLSPLMSNFGALVQGLTTVRAFCAQERFQQRVIEVTDAFQKMDHFYWTLQAWLMFRFESLSASALFLLTILAVYAGLSPGLTAFALIAANQLVTSTDDLCRQYGKLQMSFVSVERIVELLHLDREPEGELEPPAAWPTYTGDIVFNEVTIKYADHFDPALSHISCRIPAGSTTAVLGRTGSGKSTLALSILATILPSTGEILIDGLATANVKKKALRHRVTFLAQDPVLFPGSLRDNLDPLGEFSDEECDAVLQRIGARHQWTLNTQITTGGDNLSQGQRQLIGLTRAILRRSPIVILDEATASIDTETAMGIQEILRVEMRESTVITIAHRLEAVKDADYFVRLDHGKVIEQGPVSQRNTVVSEE